MKKLISILLIATLIACTSKNRENNAAQTPKALQDESSLIKSYSSGRYDDLVESLYTELVKNNADLKLLEEKINELNTSKNDSTELLNRFVQKNMLYFSSANAHIAQIKDSLMRQKMKSLITKDSVAFNSSVIQHYQLQNLIEAKNVQLADLHTILKIVKTLPLMEKYQKENIPGFKSLQGFIHKQNEAIKLADTLIK